MHNDYLDILELSPGATVNDIKKSYRRLAKKYHPDINKDDHARSQFIKITEAYKFLIDVGARPNQENVGFDYDPQKAQYQAWREAAKAYAQQKAEEEAMYQRSLLNDVYYYFNFFTIIIVGFNLLLIVDFFLPVKAHREPIVSATQVFYKDQAGKSTHRHDVITFNSFQLRLEKDEALGIQQNEAIIYTTPILESIKAARIFVDEGERYVIPKNRAYNILSWFIFLVLIFSCIYFFLSHHLSGKITFAILITLLFFIEVFWVIRFSI